MSEYRNGRLQLPNVTLAAMDSVKVKATVKALEYSMRGVDFGDVVLVTHRKPFALPKGIRYRHIGKLVHYDGFVVNPDMWRDEFLEYDYIGSPFPLPKDDFSYRDVNGNICRVGNSVSLRSKRLLEYPTKAGIPFEADHGFFNEDGFICCKNRHLFEAAGMRYAPLEVAKYFGHESMIPEVEGIRPFVFHKWAGSNAQYPRF